MVLRAPRQFARSQVAQQGGSASLCLLRWHPPGPRVFQEAPARADAETLAWNRSGLQGQGYGRFPVLTNGSSAFAQLKGASEANFRIRELWWICAERSRGRSVYGASLDGLQIRFGRCKISSGLSWQSGPKQEAQEQGTSEEGLASLLLVQRTCITCEWADCRK